MSIRVVWVDDQFVVRAGFRVILESGGGIEIVGEAGDGRSGVATARCQRPDVVLMDVRMPDVDGIEATRQLAGPARGDGLVAPGVTRRLIDEFAQQATGPSGEPPGHERLTDREREILELVADGLSNPEIAQRLYVGAATVKTHVANLLAKLGLRDRIQAVIYACEHGIVRPGG